MTEPQVQQTRKSRSFAPLFLAVLMLGTAIYIAVQLFVPSVEEDVVFTVQRGQNFKEVAEALETQGAVPSASWLRFYARLTGKDYEIKAGSFLLKKGQSPVQVLNNLIYGKPVLARVTVPEGFTAKQVRDRVQKDLPTIDPLLEMIRRSRLPEQIKAEFLENPPENPEGYLFPDTYFYSESNPEEVYTAMYRQLVLTLEELFDAYPQNPVTMGKLTLHEAIILASIVEREALLDAERPIIAGVFLKRLDRGMLLQSCATVTYVLGKPIAKLTYKDLEVDSPYNTYRYPGLPYGPISNPGRQSLEAVFNPEITDYLFFVAKGDGSHVFTRTYQEHLNAQLIHEDWLRQNSKE